MNADNKFFIYKLASKDANKPGRVLLGKQFKEPCYIQVRDSNGNWVRVDNIDFAGNEVMFHRGFGMEYVRTSSVMAVTEYQESGMHHLGMDYKPGDILIETSNSYYFAELETA